MTDATGYRLPMAPRKRIITALRQTLTEIADDPAPLAQMGEAAWQRVQRDFTWEAKARQTAAVYDWVLGRRAERPDFGMPLPDPAAADGVPQQFRRAEPTPMGGAA